jgi:hypothetical protein
MNTLEDLFLDSLADMYYAENQLLKALPLGSRVYAKHGRATESIRCFPPVPVDSLKFTGLS